MKFFSYSRSDLDWKSDYKTPPIPVDPVVDDLYRRYPYSHESVSLVGWIRMIVWVVRELERKKADG